MPVLALLERQLPQRLADAMGLSEPGPPMEVVEQWIAGRGSRPPTWESLSNVLRALDHEELSQQIEEYFTSEVK